MRDVSCIVFECLFYNSFYANTVRCSLFHQIFFYHGLILKQQKKKTVVQSFSNCRRYHSYSNSSSNRSSSSNNITTPCPAACYVPLDIDSGNGKYFSFILTHFCTMFYNCIHYVCVVPLARSESLLVIDGPAGDVRRCNLVMCIDFNHVFRSVSICKKKKGKQTN